MIRADPKPEKPIRLKGKAYKQLQIAVLERDNFTCQKCYCHTDSPPHHILLRSRGGSDILGNLITLCRECHEKEHR